LFLYYLYLVTCFAETDKSYETEKGISFNKNNEIILSRQKRNFGGSEPIDFDKALTGVFGPTGLLVQGCESFLDIVWHVSAYTILGKYRTNCKKLISHITIIFFLKAGTYNFNEPRKDPNSVRQKYLDQIFGPTAIALSAMRAFRNPLFSFSMR